MMDLNSVKKKRKTFEQLNVKMQIRNKMLQLETLLFNQNSAAITFCNKNYCYN
jgi:hypothetical protein